MDKNDELNPPRTKKTLDVRSSNRPKAPTDKMKEYQRQLFEADFEAAQRACTKQASRIQALLSDQNETYDVSVLQMERGKLEARMEGFTSAHEVLYDTFEIEEERIEQNARYGTLNSRYRETLQSLKETIHSLQLEMDDLRSTHSS